MNAQKFTQKSLEALQNAQNLAVGCNFFVKFCGKIFVNQKKSHSETFRKK